VLLSILGSVAGAETLSYTTYYHNDHLGSPVAATNEQGALLWRAHFRPYGERQENPKDAAYGSVGYTGHIQDADSGMVYAGARYYDPLIGRFMAIDPVGAVASMPGSFNRYAYVQNNPYRFIDPNGEWLEDAVIGVPSLALGASSLSENVQNGQWGGAALDAGGMVLDGLAMAVPGVPGGAGLSIQASRKLLSEGAEQVSKNADTTSDTVRQALRKAKEANGIPKSAQPDRTIKPNTREGDQLGLDGRNVKLYEYTNSSGQKIHIRQDRPASYGQGGVGDQTAHFNAGPAGQKLKQHHYYGE